MDVDETEEAAYARRDVAVEEAHRRFGGLDVPATLVGMLAALALLTLLAGLVSAAVGAIGYQTGLDGNETKLSIGGLVGGVVALFVAYFVGGWAAGRIARYDGVKNGLMTGIWTLAAWRRSSPRSARGSAPSTTCSRTSTCRTGSRATR